MKPIESMRGGDWKNQIVAVLADANTGRTSKIGLESLLRFDAILAAAQRDRDEKSPSDIHIETRRHLARHIELLQQLSS